MLYDHQLPAGGYSIIHCYDVPVLGSGAVACAHVLSTTLLYLVVLRVVYRLVPNLRQHAQSLASGFLP